MSDEKRVDLFTHRTMVAEAENSTSEWWAMATRAPAAIRELCD